MELLAWMEKAQGNCWHLPSLSIHVRWSCHASITFLLLWNTVHSEEWLCLCSNAKRKWTSAYIDAKLSPLALSCSRVQPSCLCKLCVRAQYRAHSSLIPSINGHISHHHHHECRQAHSFPNHSPLTDADVGHPRVTATAAGDAGQAASGCICYDQNCTEEEGGMISGRWSSEVLHE